MSKVQIHRIEKSKAEKIFDAFVGIGSVSQIVIGIILVLQLCAYNKSNAILQKTLDDSHIPWLEIEVKGVSPIDPTKYEGHNIALTYDIENKSDSPANRYSCIWTIIDPSTGNIHITTNRAGAINDCIMPHSVRHFNWYSQDLSGTLLNGINNEQWICQGQFTYSDIYSHRLGVMFSGAFDKGLFVITNEQITGYFPQKE
jgi:hypothetical protein